MRSMGEMCNMHEQMGERHQRDGYCNRKTEMLEAKNKNTVMKSQGKNW